MKTILILIIGIILSSCDPIQTQAYKKAIRDKRIHDSLNVVITEGLKKDSVEKVNDNNARLLAKKQFDSITKKISEELAESKRH